MSDKGGAGGAVVGQTVTELLQGLSVMGASDAEVTLLLRGGVTAAGAVAHADSEVVWLREEGMALLAVRAAEIQGVRVSGARVPAGRVSLPKAADRSSAETLSMEEPAPVRRRKRRLERPTLAPMEELTQSMDPPSIPAAPAVEEAPAVDPAAVEAAWLRDLGRSLSLVLDVAPDNEEEATNLHRVLSHLGPAVGSVRTNLLDVVERVIVAATEEPGAERVEGDLWIGVNLGAGRDGRWASARGMGAAIEAALQS